MSAPLQLKRITCQDENCNKSFYTYHDSKYCPVCGTTAIEQTFEDTANYEIVKKKGS